MPTKRLDRRIFLKLTGVAAATSALGAGLAVVSGPAFGVLLTKAQRDSLTPDEIIALMKKGNERFRQGKESPHDYLAQQRASAKGQYPAAVILSCIDSRAPAETIMDLGIGNCFNARVAGNVANEDIMGSMEFACKVAGAKVVLVMGHTACGAIKGAIDNVQLGNLTVLLGRYALPSLQRTMRASARRRTTASWMPWRERTSSSRSARSGVAAVSWPSSRLRAPSRSSAECTTWKPLSSNSPVETSELKRLAYHHLHSEALFGVRDVDPPDHSLCPCAQPQSGIPVHVFV